MTVGGTVEQIDLTDDKDESLVGLVGDLHLTPLTIGLRTTVEWAQGSLVGPTLAG